MKRKISKHANRSHLYFQTLLKAPSNARMGILQAFPSFVIDDLLEVIYNIVMGNVNIGSRTKNLRKHKKALLDLVNTKGKNLRRVVFYKQKGGFIAALLPIALGALGLSKFLG